MSSFRKMRWSWVAALGALALILTACPAEDPDDPADPDAPTPDDEPVDAAELDTYQTAIFEDALSDNYWAYLDPDASVWTGYVLSGTKCALYGIEMPAIQVVPNVAAEEFEEAQEADDGTYFVEVAMREDIAWSDGEPLTAHDLAFTFDTVREFELGTNWVANFPVPDEGVVGVESIEAVDDHTVRITFNEAPGLTVWPHSPGLAAIMPQHYWEPIVEEARGTEVPSETLYAEPGDDLSCGPLILEQWEPEAFATKVPNPDYVYRGAEVTQYENAVVVRDGEEYGGSPDGDVLTQYIVGPHFEDMVMTLYGAQDAAVLALRQGEVDFLFNPLGLERGLQDPVLEDPDLELMVNASYGFRYLAFNMRSSPMDDVAFRQAYATMIDQEFMADTVLGGVAIPINTFMPQGNVAFYDADRAEEIAEPYTGMDDAERLEQAVSILQDAGYSWDEEPTVGEEGEVVAGSGLRTPDGELVPDMTVLSPSAGYDPLRATYGLWVERWGQALGIPIEAELIGFNALVEAVIGPEATDWDLHILGFGLGNAAAPDFYHGFWHSSAIGGFNTPAFDNDEFNDAAERLLAATTPEEVRDLIWTELEPMLIEEAPMVPLFTTPIVEAYRHASVRFPFTETLGGITDLDGGYSTVTSAE